MVPFFYWYSADRIESSNSPTLRDDRLVGLAQLLAKLNTTNGHAKRWGSKRHQKDLTRVLQRPVEAAGVKRTSISGWLMFGFDPLQTFGLDGLTPRRRIKIRR